MIKYYPAQSPLHAMDARVKIACLLVLTLAALALPFEIAFLLFPLALLLFILARVPFSEASWKTIALMGAFVFAVRALFQPASGVYYGILDALYLAGVVLLVELLVKTTKPQALRDALVRMGLTKKLAFMLTLALEAIPLFQNKMLKVRIAQTARGSAKQLLPLAVPLLHSLFERSRKMGIALEARGFNPDEL